jgi:hypothetical protein
MRCTWFGLHIAPKWRSVFSGRKHPQVCVRCFDLLRTIEHVTVLSDKGKTLVKRTYIREIGD